MHEYSIVQALIEQVTAEAGTRGATRVRRVRVSIGELSGVEAGLLATAFRTFREQTACRDAELDILTVPACWTCPRCATPIPRGAILRCAACDTPARLAGGDDIVLERIELEVA